MDAGNFAVVNTKNNLACTLAGGIGTYINGDAVNVGKQTLDGTWEDDSARETAVSSLTESDKGKVYYQTDETKYYVCTGVGTVSDALDVPYSLTDASFDHTSTTPNLVVPDEPGTAIGSLLNMTSAEASTTGMVRDTSNKGVIYSAFTWDITFSITFSASASKDIGLYLDLTATNSYMTKSDNSGDPSDTGKAFKIIFLPVATTNAGNSVGFAKVWTDKADWDSTSTSSNCHFIDGGAVGNSLSDYTQNISNETIQYSYSSSSYTTANAGSNAASQKVVMDSQDTTAVPSTADTKNNNLSSKSNYLGYFAHTAGSTVNLKFKCIAIYEGTHESIEVADTTVYEVMKTKMTFGVCDLSD